MVDNVSILQIDMVWCYFMLRDITWLSVAGVRLAKARKGIEHAHGKESTRLRILQGGCYPELALHLRMELLEGVVAYHSGQWQKSRDSLISAQSKYHQLQVPDDVLSLLMSMGYKEREAKRALRMNNLDASNAIDFLVMERTKKAQRREEDRQRQKEISEQKQYGLTPLRKAVDLKKVAELVSMGFEKDLAAEALRRNENDAQKALDDLINPEAKSALQNEVISNKRKRLRKATIAASENIVSMGFDKEAVDTALRMFGNEEEALNYLLNTTNSAGAGEGTDLPGAASETVSRNAVVGGDGDDNGAGVSGSGSSEGATGGGDDAIKERDVEMEDEITGELQNADAYSDYDIEVTKEGEAIQEYLALLGRTENGN